MKTTRSRHHGLALMLVLFVIGLASLIGFAMLSSASIQAQVSGSAVRSASAEYLAESGVQSGMFYLQNPAAIPASWVQPGYTMHAQGQTIAGVDGSFDLEVAGTGTPNEYQILATGYSNGSAAGVARSARATVRVITAKPTVAAAFGGSLTIPLRCTFNGPVVLNGTLSNSGVINGVVRTSPLASDYIPPSVGSVSFYGGDVPGGTYTMPDGTTGTPQQITSPLTVAPAPLASNPGKVFYCATALVISGSVNIEGTIVSRGKVTVQGAPATVTVTPVSGFPALVSEGGLSVVNGPVQVVLNGVAWLGDNITWLGPNTTGSGITINGSLLMASGKMPSASTGGTLTVNYIPANVDVQNLTTTPQPASAVSIVEWRQ